MTVGAKVKQTLANLRGAQSVLRAYATQSQDDEAQKVYENALQTTEEIIVDIEKRLQILEFEEPQYKGF